MIKHIVMWKLKDEAEGRSREENIIQMKDVLESMSGTIPLIHKLEVGVNILSSEMNWNLVLYTEFATREDLIAYDTHPAHEKVKAFIAPLREKSAKVDYEA